MTMLLRKLLSSAVHHKPLSHKQICSEIIPNCSASTVHASTNLENGAIILVEPQNALVDEKLSIQIRGLKKFQQITLHTKITENGLKFASCGCFKANREGKVDVAQDECLGGTYRGKDAMGLFWSMKPEPGFERKRLLKSDVTTPLTFSLSVYEGCFSWEDLHRENLELVTLASTDIKRWYKSPDVKRVEIHEGNLRGVLFIPKGDGPFPALIDMFGGIGGLVEIRAALLASRGFLTLALPYFSYKDLPDDFFRVRFHYFQEATAWLYSHPLTMPGGIGAVGVSYGGVFSCAMATYLKEVVAAVVINTPPYSPNPEELDEHTRSLSLLLVDINRLIESDEGLLMKFCYVHHNKYLTKAWKSDAKFLCIVGEDDQCLDSSYMKYWYSKWPSDQRHKIEFLKYPDAGHLVEPPFSPHHRITAIRTPFKGICVWGGTTEGHAYAQEDSWKRILKFLQENVPRHNQQSVPKSQL